MHTFLQDIADALPHIKPGQWAEVIQSGLRVVELDHIVAEKHGGHTNAANLALCCLRCNLAKGRAIKTESP